MKLQAPAAASPAMASTPPALVMVPYSAMSTWEVAFTTATFSAKIPASVTGRGTS